MSSVCPPSPINIYVASRLAEVPGLSCTCFGRDTVQQECSAQGLWVLTQSTADIVPNGRLNEMTEAETQTVQPALTEDIASFSTLV